MQCRAAPRSSAQNNLHAVAQESVSFLYKRVYKIIHQATNQYLLLCEAALDCQVRTHDNESRNFAAYETLAQELLTCSIIRF
jgi:hypothetical protein